MLSPQVLSLYVIADLYSRHWQTETAFCLLKRLSYLWTGLVDRTKWSASSHEPLQIWATWLFYAVLLDLADAVAEELSLPTELSVEMLFRGVYHFNYA